MYEQILSDGEVWFDDVKKVLNNCAPKNFKELMMLLVMVVLVCILLFRNDASDLTKWAMGMLGGFFIGKGHRS